MVKLVEYENISNIDVLDLTEDRLEEALEIFRVGGWGAESLLYVKAEMMAFIKGDIDGYIRARFIMAVFNGDIVGVAAWAPSMCSFTIYELSWATVLPKWRHRGINALMLKARLQKIRDYHGTQSFEVLVHTWDNPMYAAMGFLAMQSDDKRSDKDKKKKILVARF